MLQLFSCGLKRIIQYNNSMTDRKASIQKQLTHCQSQDSLSGQQDCLPPSYFTQKGLKINDSEESCSIDFSQLSEGDSQESIGGQNSQSEVSLLGDPISQHKDFIAKMVGKNHSTNATGTVNPRDPTVSTTKSCIFKEELIQSFLGRLLAPLQAQAPGQVAKFWTVFREHEYFRRFLHHIYQTYPIEVPLRLLPSVLIFWQMNLPYAKLQLGESEALSLGMHFGSALYAKQVRGNPWAVGLSAEQQTAMLDENVKLATTTVLVLHEFFRNPYLVQPCPDKQQCNADEEESHVRRLGAEGRKRRKPTQE